MKNFKKQTAERQHKISGHWKMICPFPKWLKELFGLFFF